MVEPSLHKTATLRGTTTDKPKRGCDTNGPRIPGPPKKKRRLNRETTTNTEGTQQLQSKEANLTPILSTTTTQVGISSSLIGKIEHGQTTQISKDEVLGYKDLPMEAYEFNALLRPFPLGCPPCSALFYVWLVAGDGQDMARS